jgi:hypothetical protein
VDDTETRSSRPDTYVRRERQDVGADAIAFHLPTVSVAGRVVSKLSGWRACTRIPHRRRPAVADRAAVALGAISCVTTVCHVLRSPSLIPVLTQCARRSDNVAAGNGHTYLLFFPSPVLNDLSTYTLLLRCSLYVRPLISGHAAIRPSHDSSPSGAVKRRRNYSSWEL